MDVETNRRRQVIRVLISDFLMVVSIILIVILLFLVSTGYTVNDNLEVERTGYIQIEALPSGTTLYLDGEEKASFLGQGRIVKAGEHEVLISKKGYDSWTKKVTVTEGELLRVYNAQLFLKEREAEVMGEYAGMVGIEVDETRSYVDVEAEDESWTRVSLTNWKEVEIPEEVVDLTGEGEETATDEMSEEEEATIEFLDLMTRLKELGIDEDYDLIAKNLYYGVEYYTFVKENVVTVYQRKEKVWTGELSFAPTAIDTDGDEGFVVFVNGLTRATIDFEGFVLTEFEVEEGSWGWLNDDLAYVVLADGELVVYDYDGHNRRVLVESGVLDWGVVGLVGHKWLVYFDTDYQLIRVRVM